MDYAAMVQQLASMGAPVGQATPQQTSMGQQRWGAASPQQQSGFLDMAQQRFARPSQEQQYFDRMQPLMNRQRPANPYATSMGQPQMPGMQRPQATFMDGGSMADLFTRQR